MVKNKRNHSKKQRKIINLFASKSITNDGIPRTNFASWHNFCTFAAEIILSKHFLL